MQLVKLLQLVYLQRGRRDAACSHPGLLLVSTGMLKTRIQSEVKKRVFTGSYGSTGIEEDWTWSDWKNTPWREVARCGVEKDLVRVMKSNLNSKMWSSMIFWTFEHLNNWFDKKKSPAPWSSFAHLRKKYCLIKSYFEVTIIILTGIINNSPSDLWVEWFEGFFGIRI